MRLNLVGRLKLFMIIEALQELGLAKNEAKIYETLLREGECGVSTVSARAEINRRNVYDSMNRLIERGLVFEIRTATENRYRAVEPSKLNEFVEEKRKKLAAAMPEMGKLFYATPHKEEVFVYRGVEGWKNYLRDILRVNEDVYTIGAKGSWLDPKLSGFMETYLRDTQKAGIKFHLLFDHEVGKSSHPITKLPSTSYKFLSPEYSTGASLEVFGDHVVNFPGQALGKFNEHLSLTVIINKEIADAYRTWFKLIWDLLPEQQKKQRS